MCLSVRPQSFVLGAKRGVSAPIFAINLNFDFIDDFTELNLSFAQLIPSLYIKKNKDY